MSQVLTDIEEYYSDSHPVELHQSRKRPPDNVYFKDYTPLLYGLIIKHLGDRQLAEEVLEKTYERIWAQSKSYQGQPGLLIWMLSILRQVLREYSTHDVKEKSLQPPATLFASGGNAAQRPELNGMSVEEIILHNLIYRNRSQAEVASELNLGPKQIRKKTREALMKWR